MDGGRIVERGQHQDLLAQGGLYRQIYDLQLKDQEEFADTVARMEEDEQPAPQTLQPAGAPRR
jgi:hypothetical protein